jgi:hypothetical protein
LENRPVFPGLGVDVVADVAHVGLGHVAAESDGQREPADELAHRPAERVLIPRMRPFQRHVHPPLPLRAVREVEGEPGVAVGESAVHVPMRVRGVPLLVHVDIRLPEVRVADLI